MDGMVAAVLRNGYSDATIAQAIAHAHVSRSTFYEHFADKESCFLAAYDDLAARMSGHMHEAVERAPWPEKALAMLGAVLDPDEQFTPRWHFLLSLSRGGGARVRPARERLVCELERMIDDVLGDPPPDTFTLDIPAKAVLGGVRSVIAIRRFQGELGAGARAQLLTWLRSYAVPADRALHSGADWNRLGAGLCLGAEQIPPRAPEPRRLPRGRNRLPVEVVSGEHHTRIVRAMVEVVHRKGYAATTITDIVAAAGISRNAFYGLFRSKEETFIAAQRLGLQEGVAAYSRMFFEPTSWPERVWNGLYALLEHMRTGPELLYVLLVEPNAVGERALQRVLDTFRAFTIFLEEGYRQSPRAEALPRLCSDAIVGALFEILYDHATHERIRRLPELTPQFAYISLAPFIGPIQAAEFVTAKVAEGAPA